MYKKSSYKNPKEKILKTYTMVEQIPPPIKGFDPRCIQLNTISNSIADIFPDSYFDITCLRASSVT